MERIDCRNRWSSHVIYDEMILAQKIKIYNQFGTKVLSKGTKLPVGIVFRANIISKTFP